MRQRHNIHKTVPGTRFWNRFWNFRTGSLEPVPTSNHYGSGRQLVCGLERSRCQRFRIDTTSIRIYDILQIRQLLKLCYYAYASFCPYYFTCTFRYIVGDDFITLYLPCGAKKLHLFIFAIALSEFHLLRQFFAHIYSNKFSLILIVYIRYIIRGGEPA